MKSEDRCATCKYFHKLKELKDGDWIIKSCCTLFPQNEEGYEAFAMVVDASDMCECWRKSYEY